MSVLSQPHFYDEAAAFAKLESIIWPEGPVCPHCGNKEKIYELKGVRSKPSKKNPKGVERHGLKKCSKCRKQFTARVGTVFESSHIPLFKWMQAVHLLCSSKKGISAHQLHRVLEIKYQSAWFMAHRIREAMRSGSLAPPKLGGEGQTVEVDETYVGTKESARRFSKKAAFHDKMAVLTLVDRSGEARSFHVSESTRRELVPIIQANIDRETTIATDQAPYYKSLGEHFAEHGTVNHGKGEWRRGEIHTNTIEGFFSIFKRGMKGVYQHCSEKHLHRYLAEFDFRYNNRARLGITDEERAVRALQNIHGRRLTYGGTNQEQS